MAASETSKWYEEYEYAKQFQPYQIPISTIFSDHQQLYSHPAHHNNLTNAVYFPFPPSSYQQKMTTTTTPLPDRPPPSTASYILATFIVAACAGYFLGQASSIGIFSSSPSSSSNKPSKSKSKRSKNSSKPSWPNSYDVTVHPDSSDEELMRSLRGRRKRKAGVGDSEDEDEDSGSESGSESGSAGEEMGGRGQEGLEAFEGNREECKLVLVVRTDLGMGKGTFFLFFLFLALSNNIIFLSFFSPLSVRRLQRTEYPRKQFFLHGWIIDFYFYFLSFRARTHARTCPYLNTRILGIVFSFFVWTRNLPYPPVFVYLPTYYLPTYLKLTSARPLLSIQAK